MSDRPRITRVVLSEDHTRAALEYADRPGKLYRVTATELDSPERQQEPVEWAVSLEQPLPVSEGWPASTPIYERVVEGGQ